MITFSFPLRENPENRQVVESTGTLMPIQLGKEPFEATLHARGYSFHLIFGNQINCIWRNPVAAFAAVSGHEAERVAGFFEA